MLYNFYQISDIHIHPLQRHDEYKECFNKLYTQISKTQNNIIFLCGDILHVKDKLLSETIILLDEFISNLCERSSHVFMIPGNHDCFKSADRLDSIIGLVKIKKYSNFTYIPYSKVIRASEYLKFNVVHNHFSGEFYSYDFLNQNNLIDKSYPTICLYHGYVTKDESFFYGKKSKSSLDFIGYDYVMLGDTHRHHFVTENIVYSGSLIQQNFGETITKGYIHWKYNKKTGRYNAEFIELENDNNVYLNVYIDKECKPYLINKIGSCKKEEALTEESELLNSTHIKFFKKITNIKYILDLNPLECNSVKMEEITENIKKLVGLKEDNNKIQIYISSKEFSTPLDVTSLSNLDDAIVDNNKQNVLNNNEKNLIEYILTNLFKSKIDEKVIQEILQIHSEEKQKLNYTEEKYIHSWHINELQFRNVFIYGDDNYNIIKFNKNNQIIGILGNNAIGKSCILYVIIYALFGYISKTQNYQNKHILNKLSKEYYIKLSITLNDTQYYIIRKSNKIRQRKTGASLEETVFFLRGKTSDSESESDVEDLSASSKTQTELLIKTTLGITNKDDFTFTNIISNIMHKNILTMTNSELDDIMMNLFNTKIYKLLFQKTKDTLKELEIDKRVCENSLTNFNTDDCFIYTEKDLQLNQKKYNDLSKKEKLINSTLSKYSIQIKNKFNNVDKMTLESSIAILKNKLEQLSFTKRNDLDNLTIEELNFNIKILKQEIMKYGNEIKHCDKPEYYDEELDYIKLIEEIENYIESNKIENLKINTNFLQLEDITSIRSELIKTNILSENVHEKLKTFFSNYITNSKYLISSNIQKKIDKLNKKCEEYKLCLDYKNYADYLHLNAQYSGLKRHKEYVEMENEYNLLLDVLEYSKIHDILSKYLAEKQEINEKIIKIKFYLENNTKSQDFKNEVSEKLIEISNKIYIYSLYKELMSDKYLPKLILQKTIESIQEEANKIIFTLCNLSLEFQTTDSFKWNLVIHKNGIILGPEQCSGYERFIINIAIKIIFDKYKFYSGIKMFFIDEGLDCIAEENYDKIDILFGLLKKYYNTVIIISHNEALKSKVERIIEIESNYLCSKIVNEKI